MKNLSFNFRNAPFSVMVFFVAFLLTSCHKENLPELTTQENSLSNTDFPTSSNAIPINLKEIYKQNRQTATARSATYLIQDTIINLEEMGGVFFRLPYDELPDPTIEKIEVRMIPTLGNPDMALIAEEGQDIGLGWIVGPQRTFRRNPQLGLGEEVLTFRQSDLFPFETFAIIQILTEEAAEFRLVISGVTVDCEEYPPAQQTVTAIYAPVCGCDNQTYNNQTEAFANGITSWTNGKCPLVNANLVGEWVLEDAKLKYFDIDIYKIIIDDLAERIRVLNPCTLYDCDLDWKKLIKNDKMGSYEVVYKFKTETRYFQIELVKEGLLKVELNRNFLEKQKSTTTTYYFTKK